MSESKPELPSGELFIRWIAGETIVEIGKALGVGAEEIWLSVRRFGRQSKAWNNDLEMRSQREMLLVMLDHTCGRGKAYDEVRQQIFDDLMKLS